MGQRATTLPPSASFDPGDYLQSPVRKIPVSPPYVKRINRRRTVTNPTDPDMESAMISAAKILNEKKRTRAAGEDAVGALGGPRPPPKKNMARQPRANPYAAALRQNNRSPSNALGKNNRSPSKAKPATPKAKLDNHGKQSHVTTNLDSSLARPIMSGEKAGLQSTDTTTNKKPLPSATRKRTTARRKPSPSTAGKQEAGKQDTSTPHKVQQPRRSSRLSGHNETRRKKDDEQVSWSGLQLDCDSQASIQEKQKATDTALKKGGRLTMVAKASPYAAQGKTNGATLFA